MFDFISDVTKAVANVVVTPVAMIQDFVTLGGVLTDREETYTMERLKDAASNLNKAIKP